jgi:hypothetical protein
VTPSPPGEPAPWPAAAECKTRRTRGCHRPRQRSAAAPRTAPEGRSRGPLPRAAERAGATMLPHRRADEAPLTRTAKTRGRHHPAPPLGRRSAAAEGRRVIHRAAPPDGPTKRRCSTPAHSPRRSRCLPDFAWSKSSNGFLSPVFGIVLPSAGEPVSENHDPMYPISIFAHHLGLLFVTRLAPRAPC